MTEQPGNGGSTGEWISVLIAAVALAAICTPLIYVWAIRPFVDAQRAAETVLEDTVETISEGFLMYDADDRLALCNSKFRELYDVASTLFLIGRRFEDILRAGIAKGQYPQAEGRAEEWIAERMAMHCNPGEAIERQLPNGRWVKISETRTSNGSTVGIRTDITDLKRREQVIRESEARLRQIVDSLREGFVLYDSEDRLVMWNEKWLDIHRDTADIIEVGLSFEELLKASVDRKLYPEAFDREEKFIAERIRRHRSPGEEMVRRHRDGSWYVIREVRTTGGGIFAISIDITDLKNAENAAQEARLQAERADQSKSEFLANMSHELRTPLNAIIGFSEVMEHEAFGPLGSTQYQSYAKDIKQSGQHLLSLISDILDLSKVESGKDELREEEIEVKALMRDAIKFVQQSANKKGLTVERQVRTGTALLRADARKVTQILINLLSNAIKFTEKGGTVTLKSYCNPDHGFVFEIVDTGIGIAAENIPVALSKFSQIDNRIVQQAAGTGLGLPLTKALVEQHGGSLEIRSRVGHGTTVMVRFPADRTLLHANATVHSPAA